jgi:ribosomal protein S18 acetylase RimI-like enzyme
MPHIQIRKANASDAKLIEALARQIWMPHYISIISAEQIEFMLDQFQSQTAIRHDMAHGHTYDIAFCGDEPCGYCAVRNDGDTHFLSKLYVREDFRGRGIARALVKRATRRAQNNKASRLQLVCNKRNTGSLAAYARLGFSVTGECVTQIGDGYVMDDYQMQKAVPRSDD